MKSGGTATTLEQKLVWFARGRLDFGSYVDGAAAGNHVGGVAQMVERLLSMQEAQGSIPCSSTMFFVFVFLSPPKVKKNRCLDRGSNTGPLDLQSNALPTELSKHVGGSGGTDAL